MDSIRSSPAFDQLQSGGFRLLRSQVAGDSILTYDLMSRDIESVMTDLEGNIRNLWSVHKQLINDHAIDSLKAAGPFHPELTPYGTSSLTTPGRF